MDDSIQSSKRSRFGALVLLGALVAGMLATALPAAAVTVGTTQGCTPGYWKNHPEAWTAQSTLTVGQVFASASPAVASDSLLTALGYPGGPGRAGAERILLRHAVAAYLNSIYVADYPRTTADVVALVNNHLWAGATRQTILPLAEYFDMLNNQGTCPLS